MSKNNNPLDKPITATPAEIAKAYSEAAAKVACKNPMLLLLDDELAEICAMTMTILVRSKNKKEDK